MAPHAAASRFRARPLRETGVAALRPWDRIRHPPPGCAEAFGERWAPRGAGFERLPVGARVAVPAAEKEQVHDLIDISLQRPASEASPVSWLCRL